MRSVCFRRKYTMKKKQDITLPQLPAEIVKNARKTRLDAFAVALEGWRRGLQLKWYTKDSKHFDDMIVFGVNPPGRLFSLSSKERTHYFFRTRGDKVTNEAVINGSEKGVTKKMLDEAGVPVPQGKGIDEEFLKALHYVRHELEYPEVVVEQHVNGKEYRVYVVEDQVIAAYNRIPANIMGDGVHTIEELIDLKNRERRKNSRLNSCLIHIDREILEFI